MGKIIDKITMEKLEKLLIDYKNIKHIPSFEEEKEELYAYVYYTNKLEGNSLTYLQTTELLSKNIISGNNIKSTDILEQQGMYNALNKMILAVRNNEELSLSLLKKLHSSLLKPLWSNETAYINAKEKGQKLDSFKVSQNIIRIQKNGKPFKEIEPLSSPLNVENNIKNILKNIKKSNASVIDKSAFLAQELWLHQPFVDGNKRTARLMINFLTMKEGFPLFNFSDKSFNFNSLLVEQFLEKKPGLISKFIKRQLTITLNNSIKKDKNIKPNKNLGFRMVL